MSRDVFDRIRHACAEVTRRARRVRIDPTDLAKLADGLASAETGVPSVDPAHHRLADPDATLAFVLCIDTINFGSGWFPHLAKLPGKSGYLTIATRLRERFERDGPWTARELRALTGPGCAEVFGQRDADSDAAELMGLFARALGDLGRLLLERWDGRYAGLVAAAGGSAARLLAILETMPFFRDVSRYDELEVPFYKRAQITASDLAAAFEGQGPGRFDDLDRLTLFADNLVPHVLRTEGALVYDDALARRIDAEERLDAGSPEEVEIRAVAVHAVERLVSALGERGVRTDARSLDGLLWNRGQRPEIKAHPRHRARSTGY